MKQFRRIALVMITVFLLCTAAFAVDAKSSPREALKPVIRTMMEERKPFVTVSAEGLEEFEDEHKMVDFIREIAAESIETSGSGIDYDICNVSAVSCIFQNDTLTIRFEYLTTAEEEAAIDASCRQIREELALSGMSDFEKVRTIYEYLCTNYTYDDSLTIFTPYVGLKTHKMVCQGFAVLTYKLLWQENIPCRIIVGMGAGSQHGWNLVKLGKVWYNLDTTWDACSELGQSMRWQFFLCGSDHFPQHFRDERYKAKAFTKNQPTSEANFHVKRVSVYLEGDKLDSLMIRKGNSTKVVAKVDKRASGTFVFVSSDPSVVRVEKDGSLTALGVGECEITVSAENSAAIACTIPIGVVDLTSASSWAQDAVNEHYLDGFLPYEFCADFQTPLRRSELCALICRVTGIVPTRLGVKFSDIENDPYGLYISYLAQLGVVSGVGNDAFRPDDTLTREQLCKILIKLADVLGKKLKTDARVYYADAAQFGAWAEEYIAAASASGLMNGVGNDCFSPKTAVTREQFICVLQRLIHYKNAA